MRWTGTIDNQSFETPYPPVVVADNVDNSVTLLRANAILAEAIQSWLAKQDYEGWT